MKKNLIIFILILLYVIIGTIGFINIKRNTNKIPNDYRNVQVSIKETKYKKVGDNLYYTDELIKNKGRDKKNVLDYYQIISDYMKENFNYDIYISNLNYDVDNIYFNGYQLINEIIIEDVFFTVTIQNDKVSDLNFSKSNFTNENIDANELISVEKTKEIASDLAKENANSILTSSDSNNINGKCYLEYNHTNGIYYKINLNNGSYIKINAKTGNVIDTYFFNGIYN